MAAYPWVVSHDKQNQKLEDFPNLHRWYQAIAARPATVRAYAVAERVNPGAAAPLSDEARKLLFGQTASSTGQPKT